MIDVRTAVRPRVVVPAVVAVAALVAGGLAGVLVGLGLALVAIDRALGPVGASPLAAERTFARLARQRRLHRRSTLAYVADDRGPAATARRRDLGILTIPVASIVASADRQKAAAFDADFRPPEHSRERWTRMLLAAQHGSRLPPVSVYRLGDEHVVRDGHHRVSVARQLGAASIDAEVVELHVAQAEAR